MDMSRDVKNKLAVITGGADGIGFSIANNFLKHGAKNVVLLDINEELGLQSEEKLAQTYGKDKAKFIKCDVTLDLDEVFKIIEETYTNVDILVNSAGIAGETIKTIDINAKALIAWSLKFYEHARTDKGGNGGTIINIASILGYSIQYFAPIYQASKFAVMGFTRSLGHTTNFNKSGVRLFAVCPGFTDTAILHLPKQDPKLKAIIDTFPWQEVDAVGAAVMEMFKRADSGTAWVIEGGRPIKEVL